MKNAKKIIHLYVNRKIRKTAHGIFLKQSCDLRQTNIVAAAPVINASVAHVICLYHISMSARGYIEIPLVEQRERIL
jgi:hypothetical protein